MPVLSEDVQRGYIAGMFTSIPSPHNPVPTTAIDLTSGSIEAFANWRGSNSGVVGVVNSFVGAATSHLPGWTNAPTQIISAEQAYRDAVLLRDGNLTGSVAADALMNIVSFLGKKGAAASAAYHTVRAVLVQAASGMMHLEQELRTEFERRFIFYSNFMR